jgi:hypothetical protein
VRGHHRPKNSRRTSRRAKRRYCDRMSEGINSHTK